MATVACARELVSSVPVEPCGSMMRAPIAPLLPCLIGSDDERSIAPNSMGVAVPLPDAGTPPNRHVFYLLHGLAEQARALANFRGVEG